MKLLTVLILLLPVLASAEIDSVTKHLSQTPATQMQIGLIRAQMELTMDDGDVPRVESLTKTLRVNHPNTKAQVSSITTVLHYDSANDDVVVHTILAVWGPSDQVADTLCGSLNHLFGTFFYTRVSSWFPYTDGGIADFHDKVLDKVVFHCEVFDRGTPVFTERFHNEQKIRYRN